MTPRGSSARKRMRLICYPTSGEPPRLVAAPVEQRLCVARSFDRRWLRFLLQEAGGSVFFSKKIAPRSQHNSRPCDGRQTGTRLARPSEQRLRHGASPLPPSHQIRDYCLVARYAPADLRVGPSQASNSGQSGRCLASIPGVGPITAMAIASAVSRPQPRLYKGLHAPTSFSRRHLLGYFRRQPIRCKYSEKTAGSSSLR